MTKGSVAKKLLREQSPHNVNPTKKNVQETSHQQKQKKTTINYTVWFEE
jgi:hypothetical protein